MITKVEKILHMYLRKIKQNKTNCNYTQMLSDKKSGEDLAPVFEKGKTKQEKLRLYTKVES